MYFLLAVFYAFPKEQTWRIGLTVKNFLSFFCANSPYNKTTTKHKTIFMENNKCASGNQHCFLIINK